MDPQKSALPPILIRIQWWISYQQFWWTIFKIIQRYSRMVTIFWLKHFFSFLKHSHQLWWKSESQNHPKILSSEFSLIKDLTNFGENTMTNILSPKSVINIVENSMANILSRIFVNIFRKNDHHACLAIKFSSIWQFP